MIDRALPPPLTAAVAEFVEWSTQQLRAEDAASRITQPLYHYTNAAGLRGIIQSQKIWFTSYPYLNDPSELTYGMNIARGLLTELGEAADDGLVRTFCATVNDIFRHENFSNTFGFHIASFSRARDDLGQWRAYAENGRGFALGLAPHMFEAIENPNPQPTEHAVMPIIYGEERARQATASRSRPPQPSFERIDPTRRQEDRHSLPARDGEPAHRRTADRDQPVGQARSLPT